jgi:hypothetical protein
MREGSQYGPWWIKPEPSMWVVKYLQNMTNPVLQSTIQAATNWYASAKGITVPIWESRIDHSHDMEKAGFGLLAMLQRSWATVVRHDPGISQGDWVAYRDSSTHKQLRKDVLYEGRAEVLEVGRSPKDSATAEWYEPEPITGVMTHTPLDNGEVWHLDKRACFTLAAGEDHTKPNSIESSPNRDLYIVAGCDENGEKIKLTLEMIHFDEDMRPVEQYGPAFIKRNENGRLYKSQMFRSCTKSLYTSPPVISPALAWLQ